jgi:hypothetical protein
MPGQRAWSVAITTRRSLRYIEVGGVNVTLTSDTLRLDLGLEEDEAVTEGHVRQWLDSAARARWYEQSIRWGVRHEGPVHGPIEMGQPTIRELPQEEAATWNTNATPATAWTVRNTTPCPYVHPSGCPCNPCVTNAEWSRNPIPAPTSPPSEGETIVTVYELRGIPI